MTQLERKFAKMFECDFSEVKQVGPMSFLLLCWNRHTKDDKGRQWFKNGEPYEFAYVERTVVASGLTPKALLESAEKYKRASTMSWPEFFKEYAKELRE